MYVRVGNLGIVGICKNGTHTLTNISEYELIEHDEFIRLNHRIAFVRDPIGRIKSAFFFFKGLLREGCDFNCLPYDKLDSYETFIDYALANDDEHWRPQSQFLLKEDALIVDRIYNVKQMSEYFASLGREAGRENTSQPIDINHDYRSIDLQMFYADDYALFGDLL